MAKNNASIYNVGKKIDFIVGDFLELINDLKADVVFLSPPWGGPSYIDQEVFDLKTLQPASISTLLSAASLISKNVAAFLPRNSDTTPVSVQFITLHILKICNPQTNDNYSTTHLTMTVIIFDSFFFNKTFKIYVILLCNQRKLDKFNFN